MADQTLTLGLLLTAWIAFYLAAKRLKLGERGWDVQPFYALYKSTRLNDVIRRIAGLNPGFWRVLGNVGVAASVGQVSFLTFILVKNLWNFVFRPDQASPVQPLIPGVTISTSSLPWFLLGAGVVILTHELGHGLMCVVEGIPVKSAAVMFAVITFGGAVEPDEEGMERASTMSKMRVFAIGSMINLLTGLLTILVFMTFSYRMPPWLVSFFNLVYVAAIVLAAANRLPAVAALVLLAPIVASFVRVMPGQLLVFLNWLYFISINLAMMNMLPIGPLDGGQMWRTFTAGLRGGLVLQRAATYGFVLLVLMNIGLSLATFGLVPI
ncbi:MAG TPA: site-2 protease family protein [Candidatus Bathyarchaeia archaeon]